ncbi:MAG TPA: BON domain-containing protein [Candidatus Sulfomarinibacteraceae bacterium]|nr:BON domain-containing protein [Candidatus Sulfomarinibacteraceae bacterium]
MNEFDLQLGATVYGGEEKCGRLIKAVVDPAMKKLTHIVVEDGFLRKEAHVIPASNIVRSQPDRLDLAVGRSEIEGFHKYRQVNVEQSAPSAGGGVPMPGGSFGTPPVTTPGTSVRETVHEGVSPRLVVLDRNTPVNSVDGTVGSLQHLLVDRDTGAITRLVARRGTLRQSLPIIGAGLVEDISDERVFVNALKDDLELMPEYQAERRAEADAVQQDVEADERAEEGERIVAAELPLQRQVEAALADDPRTSDVVLDVIEERGVITLRGEVGDPQTRDAVQQVVAQVPGVLSVVNQLRFG